MGSFGSVARRISAMRACASLFVVTVLGCSCGAPASEQPATHVPPTATASATPADYEVHEWGLVRAEPGDVLRVGATPPPVSFVPIAVEKPLLYFHTAAPITLASASVTIPDGAVVEVWPLVPLGASIAWSDVRIDPSGACTPAPLPGPTDAPCASLPPGEACETSGLAVLRTADAACVRVAGASERFLFYRGRATRFTPPLRFEPVGASTSGEIRVTNESDAPIPGVLVRLRASIGWTQALTVAPPGPRGSIVVGTRFGTSVSEHAVETPPSEESLPPSTTEVGRAGLRDSAIGLGLTESEADAFLDAWSDALFGRNGEMEQSERTPSPRESFVYFLPEPLDDQLAQLAFEPPPRAVHRAIAVWSILPATGSSH